MFLPLSKRPQSQVDEQKAKDMEKKMRTASFTFEDFLDQMEQVRKMGPLNDLLKMIPGANKMKGLKDVNIDEKAMGRVEAIIKSMTTKERQTPEVINASRRRRIATGSGTSVQEVNRLLKQFEEMRKMMKQFTKMNDKQKKKGGKMKFPFM